MKINSSQFISTLPKKLFCCNHYNDNKVRNIQTAQKMRYIQPNHFNSINYLVFDIDRPTCIDEIKHDKLAPCPNIFVSNPRNHHAHLYYKINNPIHKNHNSSQKALRYVAAVELGLATKLGSDLSYGGLLAKNPLHNYWNILYSDNEAYDLHYLADFVDTTLINQKSANQPEYSLGRNCSLFDQVREWAYKAIRQGYPSDYNQWFNAVLQRTEGLNIAFRKDGIEPLHIKELTTIATSIARWTYKNFTAANFSVVQAQRGILSGKSRLKKSEHERWMAQELAEKGWTRSLIADSLGVSERTIRRWVNGDRAKNQNKEALFWWEDENLLNGHTPPYKEDDLFLNNLFS